MGVFGKIAERRYLAVEGDIVGSRRIPHRNAFQRRFLAAIDAANAAVGARALAAPLKMVAGDEVQGLLAKPEAAVDLVVCLTDGVFPVRIVFGFGYGALDTDVGPDVSHLDGPCFHRARAALESARKRGVWVRAEGFPPPLDPALSAVFRLLDAIRLEWTEKQARYVRAARGRLQKEVAASFGVSPSVVSESLKAAHFEAVLEGEDAARALLTHFGNKPESFTDEAFMPKRDGWGQGRL